MRQDGYLVTSSQSYEVYIWTPRANLRDLMQHAGSLAMGVASPRVKVDLKETSQRALKMLAAVLWIDS